MSNRVDTTKEIKIFEDSGVSMNIWDLVFGDATLRIGPHLTRTGLDLQRQIRSTKYDVYDNIDSRHLSRYLSGPINHIR